MSAPAGPPPARAAPTGPPAPAAVDADGDRLTEAYRAYLAMHPSPPGGALLAQTVAIGPLRHTFLPLVPLQAGWHAVDLGTGFGPLAFELAHREPVRVAAVDRDAAVLAAVPDLAARLDGWLRPGSSIEPVAAPAEDLPFEDGTFHLATAALLLQHVPDPAAVVRETWRVLCPGGLAFVFDVDDGLGATYPDDGPLATLEAAFDAWQASYGGDRRIGRKLSVMFAQQGFTVLHVAVLPQAQHLQTGPGEELRAMTVARLRAARAGVVEAGMMDAATFDRLLDEYEAEPPRPRCRIEARVALVARKPADAGVAYRRGQ